LAQGRHVRRRRARVVLILALVVGVLLVVAGGVAYGAYRYEQARLDRILPGVRVHGVDVSGMTKAEAAKVVQGAANKQLRAQMTVRVGKTRWVVTPRELGRRADVAAAVEEALGVGRTMGTFDRFWHRFRSEPVDVEIDLAFGLKGDGGVTSLVDRIAQDVYVAPRDASMGVNDGVTDVTFVRAKAGAKLDREAAAGTLIEAIEQEAPSVRLQMRVVRPKVTEATMGPTIVVRVDRNRLELYDGFEVKKTWNVATAKPGWTTPVGVWKIWDKRENPTWYNPALDTWGASLPAVVPGGPGNPMGTRAIYIDAPGLIRIHGTTDPNSIGRYASHGCIRMQNPEVEDLFERIPVGANVIVVGYRPAGADYWDTPGGADI
jgi:lipoprotein-anchoring transpeptidase ErfK/SrfK